MSSDSTKDIRAMADPGRSMLNSGCFRVGNHALVRNRTIVITGVGRGGTSMCVGALNRLGLFVGNRAKPPTFEDLDLFYAHERRDWTAVRQIIEDYNSSYPIWGYKLPSTVESLDRLHSMLRNPVYFVIARDVVAVGQRSLVSANQEPLAAVLDALQNYKIIFEFIKRQNACAMMYSFEKALRNKEEFVEAITSLLHPHIAINNDTRDSALKFISDQPLDYLTTTSFTGELGYLDSVNNEFIHGWAVGADKSNPPELELFINGEAIRTFYATEYRDDLKSKGIHPTGHCGFALQHQRALRTNDQVGVRFFNSKVQLRSSPQRFLE